MGKSGVSEMKEKIVFPSREEATMENVYGIRAYYSSNKLVKYLFRKRIALALDLAGDIKNKKVLDSGCGAGFLSLNLAIRGANTVAIDRYNDLHLQKYCIEKAMRDIITIKNKLSFNKADLNYIPYKSESFDIIFALYVLEHLQNPEQALLEIRRVLKINGSFIVSIPNENIFYTLGRKIGNVKRYKPDTHKHKASELINSIKQNFDEERSRSVPPFFRIFIIKKFIKSNTSQGGKI